MCYVGEKIKARKSAAGAWFSQWLAQNTCELLPSCLENLRGTAHLGWEGQRGLGTTGEPDIFQHDSTIFLTPLGDEAVSLPVLQSRRKQLSVA